MDIRAAEISKVIRDQIGTRRIRGSDQARQPVGMDRRRAGQEVQGRQLREIGRAGVKALVVDRVRHVPLPFFAISRPGRYAGSR